jgi:hypothetical protein
MGNTYPPKLPKIDGTAILPHLGITLPFLAGNIYHVRPRYGSDINARPNQVERAFRTVSAAFANCEADQNDVILYHSEGNSTSECTEYRSATLTWNKDLVHLIGVGNYNPFSTRNRIAWASGAASSSDIPLVTISASGCLFRGVSFVVGSSDANLSFGVNVTGDRNRFENVAFAYPQNAANDAAGGYALKIDGADDTIFKDCVLGGYTIDLGTAANQLLLVDSGCSMVKFDNCDFIARIESATNSPFVRLADAGAVGFGCLWFTNCRFIHTSVNAVYAQDGAFKTTASQTDGRIIIDPSCMTTASAWDVDGNDMILVAGPPTPAADTPNVARAV